MEVDMRLTWRLTSRFYTYLYYNCYVLYFFNNHTITSPGQRDAAMIFAK